MVTAFYGGGAYARNAAHTVRDGLPVPEHLPDVALLPCPLLPPALRVDAGARAVSAHPHPGLVTSDLVGADEQVALLAAVGDAGVIGLGDLAQAIPDHPRPISAVLALVDAGLLALDPHAAFDADLPVWRVPRD